MKHSKNIISNVKSLDLEIAKLAVRSSTQVIVANDKSFLLFTEGKIVLLDTKYRVEVIFEESEDVEIAKVKPILGQECAYFVLNEVTFQTHHIAQVSLQNFYREENPLTSPTLLRDSSANKVTRVFKMPESQIIAMQPCNDCLQRADADYLSDSIFLNTGLNEDQAELLVLDSNLMLQRLREQNENFHPVWSRNLGQNQILASLKESLRPYETVLLSDRTVSCRDKVVCVENATEFNSFSEELRQQDDKIRKAESIETIPEPFGNQVSYHLQETSLQVLQARPGRRGLPFAHPQLMRHIASWHQVSANLLLLQINVPRYWTLLTIQG